MYTILNIYEIHLCIIVKLFREICVWMKDFEKQKDRYISDMLQLRLKSKLRDDWDWKKYSDNYKEILEIMKMVYFEINRYHSLDNCVLTGYKLDIDLSIQDEGKFITRHIRQTFIPFTMTPTITRFILTQSLNQNSSNSTNIIRVPMETYFFCITDDLMEYLHKLKDRLTIVRPIIEGRGACLCGHWGFRHSIEGVDDWYPESIIPPVEERIWSAEFISICYECIIYEGKTCKRDQKFINFKGEIVKTKVIEYYSKNNYFKNK